MQQPQRGLRDGGQWFRLGVISATVVSPLLSRWRSLRAAERTRAVWEANRAQAQWPWPRLAIAPQGAGDDREMTVGEAFTPPRTHVRPGLWLAGAGIGLALAGAGAFVVARRLRAREAPVEIPWPLGSNGHVARTNATRASSAAGQAHLSSAALGPEGEIDRVAAGSNQDLEAEDDDVEAASARIAATSIPLAYQTAARDDEHGDAIAAVILDAEGAQVIGDTVTRTYQFAGATRLPALERRIFFTSAEQAEAAGYQLDPGALLHSDSDR